MSYTPQTDYKTTKGNIAPDFHWQGADATPQEKAQLRNAVETQYKPAKVVIDATFTYNCHALAHANRHAWFNQIDQFLKDDYYLYTPGQLKIADVCVYVKDGQLTHSGVITSLIGNTIIELRSKWGAWPEVLHGPANVPAIYGNISYYLRKRDTKFTEMKEPTIEYFDSRIDDLISILLSIERKNQILLASTPDITKLILKSFTEFTELQFYKTSAGDRIFKQLSNIQDLNQFLILSYAMQELQFKEALSTIAKKIITESSAYSFDFRLMLLIEIFDNLKENKSNFSDFYSSKLQEINSFLKTA